MNSGSDWTENDIKHARGILLNTPDLDAVGWRRHRAIEIVKVLVWIVFASVLALIHPALVLLAIVVGVLVFDWSIFGRRRRAEEQLAWARIVLLESGAPEVDWNEY